jgi:hypothetical protein
MEEDVQNPAQVVLPPVGQRQNGSALLHVVAALDADTSTCYIITVYRPDEEHFGPDLKTRKRT